MADAAPLLSAESVGLWGGLEEKLGFGGGVASLVVSMLGTGIVAFPYSFALCGYVIGPFALICVVCLAQLSYTALIRCTDRLEVISYGGLLQAVPTAWKHYTNVSLWLLLVLATAAYVLISADILRGINQGFSLMTNQILFASILLIIFPLCLLRTLSGLSIISAYCSCAIIAVVALIVYEAADIYMAAPPTEARAATAQTDPVSVLRAVPILGCAMFGHMNISQIYAELRPNVKRRADLVALTACIAVLALYFAVGAVGYAAFGREALPDVVAQISDRKPSSTTVVTMQALLASFIVLKTPLLILPLRNLSVSMLAPAKTPAELPCSAHAGLTAALLVCVYVAAVAIPDLGQLLDILGAVCVVPLSFIVPARLSWTIEEPRPKAKCVLLASAGGLASALSLMDAAASIMKPAI